MDLSEIESAIEEYYKIKGKYEKKVKDARKRIIGSDLSKRKKRVKLNTIKIKCINCGKDGGTFFSNKNRILVAKCGNSDTPCELDIQIKKPYLITLTDALNMTNEQIDSIKEAIINLKLDILFGLRTEEEIVDTFKEERDAYKMNMKQRESLKDVVNAGYEKDYTNEETGEEKKISLNQYLRIKKNKMNNFIDSFKEKIKEYMEDKDMITKNTALKGAINIYIEQIIPLMKEIRETKYDVSIMINDDDKFIVRNIKELQVKNEIHTEVGEIISNKK
jgi:hypothetical protein